MSYRYGGFTPTVAEVELVEADRWVILTLYTRNDEANEGLVIRSAGLAVRLDRPLGTRKLYDGWSGARRTEGDRKPISAEIWDSPRRTAQ